MKRILLFLSLFAFLPLQAQRVRHKPMDLTLRDYTIEEVIQMFGKPVQIDSGLIDGGLSVKYPNVTFFYFETWDEDDLEGPPSRYVPDGFSIRSRDFCIFSKYFKGGIRVGDSVERIQNLDIVHSKVGKGREKNALRLIADSEDGQQYLLLGEEYRHYFLNAKDGKVEEIFSATPDDIDRLFGGLLWKVTVEGVPAPSYILGYFPGAPARILRSIEGLEDVWKSVHAVYIQDPETGPWSRKMTEQMYLPDGKELSSLYEWEDYVDIQDYVRRVTGFPPEGLEWTPDGLTHFLVSTLFEQALPELTEGKDDMISGLYSKAQAAGLEIHFLQSEFENVFTSGNRKWIRQSTKDMLRLVREPEGEPEYLRNKIRRLYEVYQAQDLEDLTYTLFVDDDYFPLRMNWACFVNPWEDEVLETIIKGGVLLVVDFSNLYLGGLLGKMMFFQDHWNKVESVKPWKDDL